MKVERKKWIKRIIAIAALIFIAFGFFPLEKAIVSAMPLPTLPEEYRDYDLIEYNEDFEVMRIGIRYGDLGEDTLRTYLNKNGQHIFFLKLGNYWKLYNWTDNERPMILQLQTDASVDENGYIVKDSMYCSWFENGDTAFYRATPIEEITSIEEFEQYYHRADFLKQYQKKDAAGGKTVGRGVIMSIEREWYYANLHTSLNKLKGSERMGNKSLPNPTLAIETVEDPVRLKFKTFPQTIGVVKFCFFDREKYLCNYFLGNFLRLFALPSTGLQRNKPFAINRRWSGEVYYDVSLNGAVLKFKDIVSKPCAKDYSIYFSLKQFENLSILQMSALDSDASSIYFIRNK
ncbi:hypothetical protein [Bacteroides sp. 224]|uniref:hypothetical protein n=1 Tax=Bacteroides sp. 224 TaxID=2302936 RepID=UPI0013D2F040|nr:hypothetical protein [Bacteroides sp. 224]NDV65627.1 hypothetical protein [Bacteroides sp. 224]